MDSVDLHILQGLANGLKRPSIALQLRLNTGKVDARIEYMHSVLQTKTAAHLVAEGMRKGLIE